MNRIWSRKNFKDDFNTLNDVIKEYETLAEDLEKFLNDKNNSNHDKNNILRDIEIARLIECRNNMTSRGRGRFDFSSNRGRGGRGGGRGFPPIQYGQNRLINSDISGIALLKELENNPESLKRVQEFLKENSKEESSSYAKILAESDDNDSYERKFSSQDIIIILDNKDVQWKDEPWNLVQRYLGTASYAAGSYKQRISYESMLEATESVEIRHFYPANQTKVYNFSKLIIKQIISVEEWGLNPSCEKEFLLNKTPVKFTFWDYKEAFYKTFLYQNPQKKHTWWIKVCPHVYRRKIPNWFHDWWLTYGADERILPNQFKDLFNKWKKVSPAIIEAEYEKRYCSNMATLHFFCEFGIPWIWRWEPEVSYIHQNIPCLKRISFIKFWKKMVRNNSEGLMEGQDTITKIETTIAEYNERISSKQQRDSFNPFDIFKERIPTHNMSQKEQYERFMEEARQSFLQKFGDTAQLRESSQGESSSKAADGNSDDLEMFQDSQDPYDLGDEEMAEFYAKMKDDKKENDRILSESESSDKSGEKSSGKSRKKKGRNKKR